MSWTKNDYKTASEMALQVLDQLDCRLPKRGKLFHVLRGILQMKADMRKLGPNAILSPDQMLDTKKIQAMIMLYKLSTSAYVERSLYLPLSILKSYQWSVQYGMSEYSPANFALVGLILMSTLKVRGDGVWFVFLLLLSWIDMFVLSWMACIHKCTCVRLT